MKELYPKWKGKPVIPSNHAYREMADRFELSDIVEILESGFDCQRSKRIKGTVEKCAIKRGKLVRVVVVEVHSDWVGGDIWLIKHVG